MEHAIRQGLVMGGASDAMGRAVHELGGGSIAALGAVYDELGDRCFGLALWITGNREDASDVVQDALLRVWRYRRRVARSAAPEAYVLRVVRSVAVDRVRRRRRTVPIDDLVVAVTGEAEVNAEARRVTEHLAKLPEGQRSAVYLREILGMTFREAGAAMGVPTFTAASRHRLGMAKLRRWMER